MYNLPALKHVLVLFFSLVFLGEGFGQSEVIISQYIEANSGSTAKGIEIFNVSGVDIDFSSNNLVVQKGTNGSSCVNLVMITSGILLADEVWVIGTPVVLTYANTNGTNLSGTKDFNFLFNGDDALEVYLGGQIQDSFGTCGSDPGSAWTGGGVSTANFNLQIKDGICDGDTNGWTDPSERFDEIADGSTMTGFGNAPAACISCASAPASQHTNFNSSNINTTSIDLSWTQLASTNALVVMRAGSAPSSGPADATSYSGNPVFGNGASLGGGYCVYSGSGDAVTVTGLVPGTEYFIEIFSYCGNPAYYNTTAPLSASVLTEPENPDLSIDCATSNYFDLSWANPSIGSWDGFVIIARENGAPTTINSVDPALLTSNTIFTSAPDQGVNKVVYLGSGNSATITALTSSFDYSFKIFAYKSCVACDNPQLWEYSSGTQSTETALLSDVENLAATPEETSVTINWSANASCRDEIIVVASEAPISGSPTGSNYAVNSSSFIDGTNPILNAGEIVVYSGTSSSETIVDLTTNTQYCFTVFVRKGTEWSLGADICETPRTSTILEAGDLSIIAIVNDNASAVDEVCFITYKSITTNTAIDFTDNGYEREFPGLWGETEGVIRMERTGSTIAAGTPICIVGEGNSQSDFDIYVNGSMDTDWIISSLNGNYNFDLNAEDQIWFLQGGTWTNDAAPDTEQNASYSGNVLYGWTAIGWESSPNFGNSSNNNGTKGSTLYPNSSCLNTDLQTLNNDLVKYTGSFSSTTKNIWISRLNDANNWTSYTNFTLYEAASPQYLSDNSILFDITDANIYTEGLWNGNESNDWFNCANWASLRLPESDTDVVIPDVLNDPVINSTGAESNVITIETGGQLIINSITSELEINGDLILEGTGIITNSNGSINFVGSTDQTITDNLGSIQTLNFQNITVNKPSGNLITEENISINQSAIFANGIVIPNPSTDIIFQSTATTTGASNASYIDGKVQKVANTSTNFTFPIGDSNANGNFYQPVRIFDLSAGTSTFEAQYFAEANPFAGAYYDGDSNSPDDNQEIGNCDYWTVNRTSGTENVKLALTYTNDNPAYCNVVTEPTLMRIASLNPSFEWDITNSSDIGNEIVMAVPIESDVTGGTYGDFAFYSTGGANLNALPIELLSFSAEAHKNSVVTKWNTATETNNDYFTVERSADARSFMPIANIDGAGTSHSARHYSFVDDGPLLGVSYYRLKQTDFDGVFSYSDIKAVNIDGEDGFVLKQVYRNESELNLVYKSSSPFIQIEIFDVLGQQLVSQIAENYGGRSILNLNLKRGAYIVRISSNGNSDSGKMVW